jgi:hypothetical protein
MVRSLICSKCGGWQDRIGQRYCRLCANAYVRATKIKYPMLSEAEKVKARARSLVNMRQKRGHIEAQPCGSCGAEKAEKHHPDYDEACRIEWLCRACHIATHEIAA